MGTVPGMVESTAAFKFASSVPGKIRNDTIIPNAVYGVVVCECVFWSERRRTELLSYVITSFVSFVSFGFDI